MAPARFVKLLRVSLPSVSRLCFFMMQNLPCLWQQLSIDGERDYGWPRRGGAVAAPLAGSWTLAVCNPLPDQFRRRTPALAVTITPGPAKLVVTVVAPPGPLVRREPLNANYGPMSWIEEELRHLQQSTSTAGPVLHG